MARTRGGTKEHVLRPAPAPVARAEPAYEAEEIRAALLTLTRSSWDGQLALLEMASAGVRDVDPESWPAAYFAHLAPHLLATSMASREPRTVAGHRYAFRSDHTWELTTAEEHEGRARIADLASVRGALSHDEGLGIVVALGRRVGDVAAFRSWLDRFQRNEGAALLGQGRAGVATAPAAFRVTAIRTYYLRSSADLDAALAEGWFVSHTMRRTETERGAAAAPLRLDLAAAGVREV